MSLFFLVGIWIFVSGGTAAFTALQLLTSRSNVFSRLVRTEATKLKKLIVRHLSRRAQPPSIQGLTPPACKSSGQVITAHEHKQAVSKLETPMTKARDAALTGVAKCLLEVDVGSSAAVDGFLDGLEGI